jgi:CBS-domain-containing membrane protein
MSTYPTPAAVRTAAITPLNLAKLTALFRGGSSAAVVDAIWVPAVAATLIVAAGALGQWLKQPWLFAGLGPTVLMLASNPGHETTRFRAVVTSHLAAIGCSYLALLMLNANIAAAVVTRSTVAMPRVWASAVALAMLTVLMPQLRAYHPPAAATALLVTLGAYRMTGKTPLALMAGVVAVALLAELLNRIRPRRKK